MSTDQQKDNRGDVGSDTDAEVFLERVFDEKGLDIDPNQSSSPEGSTLSSVPAEPAREELDEKSRETAVEHVAEPVLNLPSVDQAEIFDEKRSDQEHVNRTPPLSIVTNPVSLVRLKPKKPTWSGVPRYRYRMNLLGIVGLQEFGNACDFPANVWNKTPLPPYAIFLMVLGGSFALIMSFFTLRDLTFSWDNVKYLRRQREELKRLKVEKEKDSMLTEDIDVLLDANYRELGSEVIHRAMADGLGGFAAILVGVGTFMAIGGANKKVFHASNLLSGYIGNTPLAAFGLLNACWSSYIWLLAAQHASHAVRDFPGRRAGVIVKKRARSVQVYATVNGVSALLGGAGSMITATMWWGYIMLIPVIFASLFCNYWWRKQIGYDRPDFQAGAMSAEGLALDIEKAELMKAEILRFKDAPLSHLLHTPLTMPDVVDFLCQADLFEDFCLRLVNKSTFAGVFVKDDSSKTEMIMTKDDVLALVEEHEAEMIEIAQKVVSKHGAERLHGRQWYLAEILGSHLCLIDDKV